MPIRQFIDGNASFGPEDLRAMGDAFSEALIRLRVCDAKDPLAEAVARKIIRAALAGERDPVRLCQIAVDGVAGSSRVA